MGIPRSFVIKYNKTIARELAWSLCDLKIRNKKGKTAADVVKERATTPLQSTSPTKPWAEQVRLRRAPTI